MKCRDGCENEKSEASDFCGACWMRLRLEDKDALADARICGRGHQRAMEQALTWLAADDKGRG